MSDIKVCLLKYEPRQCWSVIGHKYYYSDNIDNQVWAHENTPLKTYTMDLKDAIEYIKNNPGDSKAHRNALMKFDSPFFPVKSLVGMDKWTGIIYVDLDIEKSNRMMKMDEEKHSLFYHQLDYALQNLLPNNYCYIEHSSSGVGIHAIFYFNCERTIENFNKYAEYVYKVFRYDIDAYIMDFSHIFTDVDCLKSNGRSKIFDEVYARPYQKIFITSKDCIYREVDGSCDDIVFELAEKDEYTKNEEVKTNGTFNIEYVTNHKKWELDHNDRFYVLTALKKYCSKEQAREIWNKFCEDISLYKNYKTRDFINQFDREWDKIDESKGHISILSKYGISIDDKSIFYNLKSDQYLSDVVEDIVANSVNGLNMVIADTGIGKTKCWIMLNDKYSNPLEINNHKPVLVIEPLNSIVESKYDETKFRIVTGSKQIGNLSSYEMIITNYNHLVRYTEDGIEVLEDINDVFSKFELVIIDESHIMMKDAFRADVLVPFLLMLNKIDSTKVVIQTATPMFENSVLNIKKVFHVQKENKTKNKLIFRNGGEKFNIQDITCLVDYYINNGKKVYIYWSNGSLQNMKQFKTLYHDPDNVVIYHKRHKGDIDMQYVTEKHNIENYNIIMSSVYFGVGNDLEDRLNDVATIIIGMNSWQEDIQADGRWRNVNNNETCIILTEEDMEFVDKDYVFSFSDMYDKQKFIYDCIYKDKFNRDKSVIVNGLSFILKNKEYVDIISKIKTAIEYSKQFKIKCDEFERRGYDVRQEIKPLVTNIDWTNEIKKYKQDLKDIHNVELKRMIEGEFDYCVINQDSKLQECARIIKKLKSRGLLKHCDLDKMTISKVIRYGTFLKYYERQYSELQDYSELFSILWCRENLLKKIKKEIEISGISISYDDYIIICGYLIWLSYRNKEASKEMMRYLYFSKFKSVCLDFAKTEQKLVEKIFIDNYYDESFNNFYKEFFNISDEIIKSKENITNENLFNQIAKMSIDEDVYKKTLKVILDQKNYKKERCSDAGKNGRKIEIDGQNFNTVKEAAEKLGISRVSVYKKLKVK